MLTPRKRQFVQEYLIDLNGTQAAIRAGYSPKGARVQAVRLLADANVKALITKASNKRTSKTEIDAEWLLRDLAQQAQADVADLYTTDGAIKPVSEWPLVWRQGLVAGIDTAQLEGGVVVTRIKLADRTKIRELLGKHTTVGAFTDRIELTGRDGGPILVDRARQIAEEFLRTPAAAGIIHDPE